MAQESANDFYRFGMLMAEDSKLLYENNRLHNSVYFAVFALEAYLKMNFRLKGKDNYIGHIKEGYVNDAIRECTLSAELFNPNDFTNMIDGYNINDRYKVDKWTNIAKCENIQTELVDIEDLLGDLRIQG